MVSWIKQAAAGLPFIGSYYQAQNAVEDVANKNGGGYDYDWIPGLTHGQGKSGADLSNANVAFDKNRITQNTQSKGGSGSSGQANDNNPRGSGQNIAASYDPQAAAAARADAAGRASTIGMLDQELAAISKGMGNLDTTWGAGRNQIEDAYNKGMSRLNEQQSNALSKYAKTRGDTKESFHTSLQDNDNQAYNNFTALNNLLGRGGAGSSSASQNLVPYAVSKTASKARGALADNYGKNMRDLNDSEEETKQSYNNSVRDLGDQKNTNLGSLENDIQTKRRNYEDQKAKILGQKSQAQGGDWNAVKNSMAGATKARDDIDTALAGLLDRYRNPYSVKDVTVKDPTMRNYAVDTTGVKASDPNGTGTDTDTSASYLRQMDDEEKRKKEQSVVA